ncbi:MAG: hypothetical protein ABI318_09100 [Chthoniobacteraceae bacterium]
MLAFPALGPPFTVNPAKVRQEFQGLGCGAMFYEAHITSFAARGKDERQRELYDDMLTNVNTRFLNLMIRAPSNTSLITGLDAGLDAGQTPVKTIFPFRSWLQIYRSTLRSPAHHPP